MSLDLTGCWPEHSSSSSSFWSTPVHPQDPAEMPPSLKTSDLPDLSCLFAQCTPTTMQHLYLWRTLQVQAVVSLGSAQALSCTGGLHKFQEWSPCVMGLDSRFISQHSTTDRYWGLCEPRTKPFKFSSVTRELFMLTTSLEPVMWHSGRALAYHTQGPELEPQHWKIKSLHHNFLNLKKCQICGGDEKEWW
jgi:hypothetical protein